MDDNDKQFTNLSELKYKKRNLITFRKSINTATSIKLFSFISACDVSILHHPKMQFIINEVLVN